jgi:hypothetical protein
MNIVKAGLLTMLCAGGCSLFQDVKPTVTYGWVNGGDHVLAEGDTKRVILDEAARDLACPKEQVVVIDGLVPHGASVAEGCGRRGVFVLEYTGDEATARRWYRASDVSEPHDPPPTPVGSVCGEAQRWVALVRAGAHDLACPPSAVTPDFVPQPYGPGRRSAPADVPIVEGCGKRATYMTDRSDTLILTAIVAIPAAR